MSTCVFFISAQCVNHTWSGILIIWTHVSVVLLHYSFSLCLCGLLNFSSLFPQTLKMRVWIVFVLFLAGHAMAAPVSYTLYVCVCVCLFFVFMSVFLSLCPFLSACPPFSFPIWSSIHVWVSLHAFVLLLRECVSVWCLPIQVQFLCISTCGCVFSFFASA